MTRLLIADDETLLRAAIGALLDLEDDLEVVAQAGDGREAIELARMHLPDVVLLDLEMPGLDGIETAEALLRERPGLPIVLLTRHARPGVLKRALAAGVRGFLGKAVEPAHLAVVVREVHAGRRYIDAEISMAAMLDDCPLSDRELDALRLTLDGLSVREIGTSLHLAPGTVRNYLSSAMGKLGAASRHDAARRARERAWI